MTPRLSLAAAVLGAMGLLATSLDARPRQQLAQQIAGPMSWPTVERLIAGGRAQEAVVLASQMLVKKPRNARGLYLRGRAHFHLGNCDLAEADLSRAIDLDSGLKEAYAWRALAWRCKRDDARSLADLDAAIGRGLRSVEMPVYVQGRLMNQPANLYGERGVIHQRLGHAELAVADFTRALKMDPSQSFFYNYRSDAYVDLGRFDEAAADAETAAGLAPDFHGTFNTLGVVRFFQGRYEEALRHYARAIDLARGDREEVPAPFRQLHVNRSLALWQSRKQAEAILEVKKALGSGNATGEGIAYFHLAYFEHEQGHAAEAQSYFARARELFPGVMAWRLRNEHLYARHPANRALLASIVEVARQHLEGAAPVAPAAAQPAAAPPAPENAAPAVTIQSLVVDPAEPLVGAAFDIRLGYRLSDPVSPAARIVAKFRFEIADSEHVLFRSEPIPIEGPNGEEGAWVQHMNPSRRAGQFTVKASLELEGQSATREVELRIR